MRVFLAVGAVIACFAVLAGAFGAHALKGRLDPERLAILALTGEKRLGAVTPFGGLFFMVGWLFLAWGVMKKRPA